MRLRLADLGALPGDVRTPGYDPSEVTVGIVHLGIGAFHRAHQAVYTDAALAADGGAWGICGFSQRSATVPDQLRPQDGLYTVLSRGEGRPGARVVGSIRTAAAAPADPGEVVARIASPDTRIVSSTVTEKGYRADPSTGRLDLTDEGIRGDLADGAAPATVIGQVVRGIQRRMRTHGEGITVLSCDNLPANGRLVQRLVEAFVEALPADQAAPLAAWIAERVTFPMTMVDRIVPATSEADLREVAERLGRHDLGAVVAEPFTQWVIEDRFVNGRPAWDLPGAPSQGATFTADVAPFEHLKLRTLNGSHSLLAYLGALDGRETIREAVDRDDFALVAARQADEAATTLDPAPEGVDLGGYRDQVLARFANPSIRHRCAQVAMDGSQKLPQRLLETARARLEAGQDPTWSALGVAAWMRYLQVEASAGRRIDDPMASRLGPLAAAADRPAVLVDRLLGVGEVFAAELAEDAGFASLVRGWVAQLSSGAGVPKLDRAPAATA